MVEANKEDSQIFDSDPKRSRRAGLALAYGRNCQQESGSEHYKVFM